MKKNGYYYIEFKSMLIDSGKFKVIQILNSNQNEEKVYFLKNLKSDNYKEATEQEIKRFIELYYF